MADVPDADVDFLLNTLNTVLAVPVSRDQVAGAHAGLRPLLDAGTGRTADLSRRHAVLKGQGRRGHRGRRQAHHLPADGRGRRRRGLPARPPQPDRAAPLVGATLRGIRAPWRLVERYGSEAEDIAALIESNRALGAKVIPGGATTWAELVWAVRHEGALDEDDMLDRRTRIRADRGRPPSGAESGTPRSVT